MRDVHMASRNGSFLRIPAERRLSTSTGQIAAVDVVGGKAVVGAECDQL